MDRPAEANNEMETQVVNHPWFALQVKGRSERLIHTHLHDRGFESFLPVHRVRRRWSDRIKELEQPLFPGYVFCRFDPQNRLPVLTVPGVMNVVGFGRKIHPVEDHEIAAIQRLLRSGLPCQPWPFLNAGDRVRIEHGCLRDVEGILVSFKKQHRIVVSVSLLQRSVAVELDSAMVEQISAKRPEPAGVALTRAWSPVSS
jgi:transcription antitermination factor NusG